MTRFASLFLLFAAASGASRVSSESSSFRASTAATTRRQLGEDPTRAPLTDGVQEALDAAMALWESKNITAYKMGFQRVCYCTEEYRLPTVVKVENGVAQWVRDRETLQVQSDELLQNAYTVENIFGWVQQGLDSGAYSIDVEYNEEYGFATSLRIDYDPAIVDEELSVTVDYMLPVSKWQDELTANQQVWATLGLQNYSFTFQEVCLECPPNNVTAPIKVQVINGELFSVDGEEVNTGSDAAIARIVELPDTVVPIPELLDYIQERIQDPETHLIQVEYNATYGYPTSVFIDFSEYIGFDEMGFELSGLTETPQDNMDALAVGRPVDSPGATASPMQDTASLKASAAALTSGALGVLSAALFVVLAVADRLL